MALEKLPKMDEATEDRIAKDARLFGAGYAMFLADGTVQRLTPEEVWFRPAPKESDKKP